MPEDEQSVSNNGQADNKTVTGKPLEGTPTNTTQSNDVDEFGLPIRPKKPRIYGDDSSNVGQSEHEPAHLGTSDTATLQEPEDVVRGTEAMANGDTTPAIVVSSVAEVLNDAIDSKGKEPAGNDSVEEPHELAHDAPVSEWSHMQLAPKQEKEEEEDDEGEWQTMPAFATHAIYDDWGKVLAREEAEMYEEENNLGGAGKGYTKVNIDEDAQSATSMDDDTAYLFKQGGRTTTLDEEDEEGRDMLSQMQTTKELLTEGQRIAYVGIVKLCSMEMVKELDSLERTKGAKKVIEVGAESIKKWGQTVMIRLYGHMDVDSPEQIMIEQLAEHGVEAGDLTPALMQNARVKNPMKDQDDTKDEKSNGEASASAQAGKDIASRSSTPAAPGTPTTFDAPPPPYSAEESDNHDSSVKTPGELGQQQNKIDIDLRWTVLCDLFLVLIADSAYDSRSRTLLERVGRALSISWLEICRFEKRVTDALEMQQEKEQENWNEEEHMTSRSKATRNKRLMYMGLATVGGGLVIGLSAGLLAPVIGAGLAAGFTTIGVAGTSTFFGGAGAAALITSTGIITGANIGVNASKRRLSSVKTFEYRPLFNNKRVNLIVTVAGWMTGKVDDVRLPYSTINPVMGDIYSVLWEPEMLQSMGQTINILATEALTQGLQQILASTVLTALMGALQLPLILTKLAYLVDNPWNVSMSRADQAGLILADSLIDRNLGSRPITLVAFSIGARVVFSCLKELAKRGAYGIVQNVYMFGSPVVVHKDDWLIARSVVPGRFVSGYATNDWILGYLFRATAGGIMRIAGLAPTQIPGVEDINVTDFVKGHMAYRAAMPRIMQEVGWDVDSLEFTEIEDADPENYEARQRELINEIEEARKALEKKPSARGLRGLFLKKSKKVKEKQAWETYDERMKAAAEHQKANPNADGTDQNVLFDIDAINAEVAALAAHGLELKEVKGTLPPLKLNLESPPPSASSSASRSRPATPPSALRHTQSFSSDMSHRPKDSPPPRSPYGQAFYDSPQVSLTFEDDTPARSVPGSSSQSRATSQAPSRPQLHSANTMPTQSSYTNSSRHNAWADEEEEFGKEHEMSMTFE
ncbi:hypothetical protein MBLNU457_7597t1 [Dothideomycetes sp. NU457]